MEISKILNNNVVITKDDFDNEIIVMGRGIAFKKRIGDSLDKNQIDKIYTLKSDVSIKFQELLLEIPLEYIETSNQIIDYIKDQLGENIHDSIYISLTDHIFTAIKRYKQQMQVKNMLLWDIKKFYKDEYELGLKALKIIQSKLGYVLDDDEAGFIALHIVNSEMNEKLADTYEVTKLMHEILKIVTYYFHVTLDENSVYYYRFITHLKFFAFRLLTKSLYSEESNDQLLEIVKNKYAQSYKCCLKVQEFLKNSYDYTLSQDEILYLTIHVSRLVAKN